MKKFRNIQTLLAKSYHSQFSGKLTIKWNGSRKLLDSSNANYSYGALQEVLDEGLSEVRADRAAPVLLLGAGGGSAIPLLRKKYGYYNKITAVEVDPVIIKIARKEFNIEKYQPLKIVCADAEEYVKSTEEKFGLVIVDIFLDLLVPEQFFSLNFWKDLSHLLHRDGKVLFNAGVNSAHWEQINCLLENDSLEIAFLKKEKVNGSNTLLLGEIRK